MKQQNVRPKAIYSVLGGAASSYKFAKEFADAANGVLDVNHWFKPEGQRAWALKKRVDAMKDQFFTYEVYLNYSAVQLLADAIERRSPPSATTSSTRSPIRLGQAFHAVRARPSS